MPRRPDDTEFDWLYDASDDAADHTRVLPAVPADPATAPPRGPLPPGQRPVGPALPRRTRVRWRRILLLVLIAWLVFLVVVPLVSWGDLTRVDATPAGNRPAAGNGTTYLMVGSDSRKGLSPEQNQKLGTGGVGVDAGRTDTIMLLHTGNGPTTLVSIPRDSLVKIPGHGTDKINAAFFFGGPKLLVQTIEQDANIHIDHFVEVGLGGYVQAVDAVGGVQICPDTNLVDPLANLNVKAGCQQADGATALAWARSRHAFALGDIAREEHQRQIVHEVGSKALSVSTFVFPWRYIAINNAAVTALTVDDQMGMFAMLDFAKALTSVGSGAKQCGMPISDLDVHWDKSRVSQLVHYLTAGDTGQIPDNICTPTGLQK